MTEFDYKTLIPDYLIKSATYDLIVIDQLGLYLFVNDRFRQRYSFLGHDFIGKQSLDSVHPDDHEACLKAAQECVNNPDSVVQVKLRKTDTAHTMITWTLWELSMFRNNDGEPVGILCLGQDLSALEEANRTTEVFAEKMEAIIEEITDGFFQLDEQYRFLKINRVGEKILGVTKEQVVGQIIWNIFPDTPEYHYPAQFRKAMKENVTVNFEEYHKYFHRWFETIAYPSSEGLTVFFRDITLKKHYQDTILQQNRVLKDIAWQQSHELRRPLANILGLCDLLGNYQNEPEEVRRRYIENMLNSAKDLDTIIHKIVSTANISSVMVDNGAD